MQYVSTRGQAPVLGFDDVLLTGLARDGGLYLPAAWPVFPVQHLREMRGLSYAELAAEVMAPFVEGAIERDAFDRIVAETYSGFTHDAVAPLVQLGTNEYLMELFHGPTLAFKDYALQLVGRLFDHVLDIRGERMTVLGATSGDTGSAAIEACRDRDRVDIFILHPKGRVSDVQRRQMTTVLSANVHNIALEGSFDDAQDLVKAAFNDLSFRDEVSLGAVNSINWARIMGQIVYYFWAAIQLGAPERRVSFAVPTGNFGNVFAGYAAKRMGLPVGRLAVGSNRNDILTRFFETGEMTVAAVEPSISPSMDIQISSNFERLLFDMHDRNGAAIARMMAGFRETGTMVADPVPFERMCAVFDGYRLSDEQTAKAMGHYYAGTGELVDPHSAIGIAAGRVLRRDFAEPMVALATAHPAKFPDAVCAATGVEPVLPPHLSDLHDREERTETVRNDLGAVQAFVRSGRRTG